MDSKSTRYDVAVVGGGLGGLAVATWLARDGASVILFEKSSRLGGRAVSQQLTDTHRVNLGPHALYRAGPALKLLRELGVEPTGGVVTGDGALGWRGGRLHTLPSGPVSLLTTGLLQLPGRLEFVRLLTSTRSANTAALMQVPLAEWVDDTLEDEDARALARTLFRLTTYSADFERLSAGAAIEQFRIGLRGVIYADGGWQQVSAALEVRAREAGVCISTGLRVEQVSAPAPGELRVVRLANGEEVRARAVVIASDPATVARLVDADGALGVARRLEQLVPVRAACLDVALTALPRPRHLIALGVGQPVYAAVHSRWAKLVDGEGAVVQLAKYLHAENGSDGSAEAELEALLDALQPGWRQVVVGRRFLPRLTVSHALPTAQMGGTAGRPGVEVPEVPGVFLVGDWVGPTGMLLDAVMSSAHFAAQRVRASVLASVERRVSA